MIFSAGFLQLFNETILIAKETQRSRELGVSAEINIRKF